MHIEDYAQIYRDLAPFMGQNTKYFRELDNAGEDVEYGSFEPTPSRKFTVGNQNIFGPITELLEKPFRYAISSADEPQMAPSETSQVEYTSPQDAFTINPCFQKHFDTPTSENKLVEISIKKSHGFFQGPDTFLTRNARIPIFSQSKTHCFEDILMPMDYHVEFATFGLVRDGIAWEQKEDVLFWRGATSGGRYGRASAFLAMRLVLTSTKPATAFKAFVIVVAASAVIVFSSAWVVHNRNRPEIHHSSKSEDIGRIKDFSKFTETSSDDPPIIVVGDASSNKDAVEQSPQAQEVPLNAMNWREDYINFRTTFSTLNMSDKPIPPPGFDKWAEFAEQKQCLFGLQNYAQIYRDLEPFMADKSGFKQLGMHSGVAMGKFHPGNQRRSLLEYVFSKRSVKSLPRVHSPGRFTVGIPSILNPAANFINSSFEYAMNIQFDEPQMLPSETSKDAFYRNWDDVFQNSKCFFMAPDNFLTKNARIPLISQAKAECFYDIVAPMKYHVEVVAKGPVNDPVPFEQKKNVLFWRGASTSGRYAHRNPWRKFHRTRLLEWEKLFREKYPNNVFDAGKTQPPTSQQIDGSDKSLSWLSVDIGFHKLVQTDPDLAKELETLYPFKSFVTFQKTIEFKYLLVLDGNTWPSRLPQYLETNSVVLLGTAFTDWFMWMLEPFVHYVPVKMDLSDLEERLRWLRENDDKARLINFNAKAFMKRINRMEQMQCYNGLLMMEYSRLYHEARELA
ncbi:UNVERIFIED_CONTAM: F-actin-capping protein subunit alpha [Siphonaria sp. JEL0065]|nr:F-actin-capping protein subunit alpha [Siphonaria sp. JEL0065]